VSAAEAAASAGKRVDQLQAGGSAAPPGWRWGADRLPHRTTCERGNLDQSSTGRCGCW